ncbi:MAG: endolytic transglycosylase MltG [Acidimicrobiales bacterium]
MDPVEPASGPPRRHLWRIAALIFVVVGAAVLVGGYLWINSQANPSGPAGPQVIVTVRPGAGVNQLASDLASRRVIGSSLAYRIWSRWHRPPAVLSGSYAFRQNSSFSTVDGVIAAGPNVFPLNVPPGFTVAEVAERVGQLPGHSSAGFLAVAEGGTLHSPWQPAGVTSLEGLLGTGRYVIVPGETDTQLLSAMIDRFDKLADSLGLTSGSAQLGLTPYQTVVMASIVEKEGVIAKNLGPVARVILNRLHDNMPLQMDSTVLFAEGRDGGPVTGKDLQTSTPYNTYLNKGLTPTPICFPSRAALQAALDPPPGSWLYFVVVQPDGTEAFADTFAEQQANEALAKQRGLP